MPRPRRCLPRRSSSSLPLSPSSASARAASPTSAASSPAFSRSSSSRSSSSSSTPPRPPPASPTSASVASASTRPPIAPTLNLQLALRLVRNPGLLPIRYRVVSAAVSYHGHLLGYATARPGSRQLAARGVMYADAEVWVDAGRVLDDVIELIGDLAAGSVPLEIVTEVVGAVRDGWVLSPRRSARSPAPPAPPSPSAAARRARDVAPFLAFALPPSSDAFARLSSLLPKWVLLHGHRWIFSWCCCMAIGGFLPRRS